MPITRKWQKYSFFTGAIIFFIGIAASHAMPSDGWLTEQFVLLGDSKKNKMQAVKALVERADPNYYALLKSMFKGEVYRLEERQEYGGIVLTGDELEDEYGDISVALYTPYPFPELILDTMGEPRRYALDDLAEIDTNRQMRKLIQGYLLKMELFDKASSKRRAAAENMGNKGDASLLEILTKAIVQEQEAPVLQVMRAAKAKILLQSTASQVRLEGVRILRKIGATETIDILKERLVAEEDTTVRTALDQTIEVLKQRRFFYEALQTLFIGLSLGSILVLMALGLAIIYGQMGVINMAHGEFMMVGAYTTYVIQNLCMDILPRAQVDWFFVIALPFSFLVAGILGWIVEYLVIRHLYQRPLESLLATWGISLVFVQSARSIFGDLTAVKLPQLLQGGWEILPQIIFPYSRIFIMVLTGVIIMALIFVLFRTRFGLRLRAVTQNRDMSSALGIPARRIDALTFMLGSGIAGIAGWALTLIGNVVPNMGQTYIVDSFLVVVTGGVGKLIGTVSAGMGIGIVNKILEPTFEAVYAKVIILGLIIFFLQARPTGIFPAKGRSEEL